MLRREVVEPRRRAALRAALVDVRVPAAESANATSRPTSAFESCAICFSAWPNGAARIVGAVLGLVARRDRRAFSVRSRRRPRGRCRSGPDRRPRRTAPRTTRRSRSPRTPNCVELVHRQRRRRALQHARQLLASSATARNERRPLDRAAPAGSDSASRRRCSSRRACRLHVVLRVEVRARGVGRAAGVNDGELPRDPRTA